MDTMDTDKPNTDRLSSSTPSTLSTSSIPSTPLLSTRAREIFDEEIEALRLTRDAAAGAIVAASELVLASTGKVVVTGVGKSGLIGQKIAATLSSTGTTAIFMHGGDGIHGDLGALRPEDIVLALSFSGSTIEILSNLPTIKRIGARIIAMVGDVESPLAREANAVIPILIRREACGMNLAPSSSTTAMLAAGDALALLLSERRGFRPEDFALYHPGGALGRRLLLRVRDLMRPGDALPWTTPDAPLTAVVEALTRTPMGAVNIIDDPDSFRLAGLITDGDIRRALSARERFFDLTAREIMTRNPVTTGPDTPAGAALALMENRPSQISVLPVVDPSGRAVGMIRLHDLIQAGARAPK